MCGQKDRSLVRWRTLSPSRCPISSCNSLNTVLWNLGGRTSCRFQSLRRQRFPSSPMCSFSHSKREMVLSACLAGCVVVCHFVYIQSLFHWPVFPLGLVELFGRNRLHPQWRLNIHDVLHSFRPIATGKYCKPNCLSFALNIHSFPLASIHSGSTSSLHSLKYCLIGILDNASASLFAVSGQYFIVKLKSERSATQQWTVALCLAEVST